MSAPSASAATATAAAAPLPAVIQSYLDWGRARLLALGLADGGGASAGSAVVAGAPLCAARVLPGEGCGLVLTRDLPAGSHLLFRAPGGLQFRAEHSAVAPLLPPVSESTAWLRMALALLYERHLGAASPFAPFIAAMPSRNDQPMFWSQPQLDQLQGCTFLPNIHFFDFDRDYETKVLPWLHNNGKKAGGMTPRNCSVEDFCLVNGWIISRAFRPKCAPTMGPVMMPIIDLLNTTSLQLDDVGGGFHRRINTSVDWVGGGKDGSDLNDPTLVIRTLPSAGPLKQGQQLYLPYGSSSLGNSDLLIRYGFTEGRPLSDNPHDTVSLDARRIVQLLEGGDSEGAEAHALTNPAEASEEEEARALHRKHTEAREAKAKVKAKGAAGALRTPKGKGKNSAPAAAAAVAIDDNDSDNESCGSAASGDSSALTAHLDLVSRLPFESFQLGADGSLPDRLLQFVAVLLGAEDGDAFLRACEADAEKQRIDTQRELQQSGQEQAQASAAAANGAAAAGAAASASSSASPPVLSGLSSADVLESLFFVFHHLLGCYATTLEDDVKLLDFFTRQRGTSPAEPSENARRMELALHARIAEKRIIYRALDNVKRRLAELAANMVDVDPDADAEADQTDNSAAAGASSAASLCVDPSAAVAAAMDSADESDTDLGAEHPDPNILSPSLYRMLAAQKRPSQDEAQAEDDPDQEETGDDQPSLRFTYSQSARTRRPAKKRRA